MTLYERACQASSAGAKLFGHPFAVLLFPPICATAVALAVPMDAQTYLLSVLAITTSQMVLVVNFRDRAEDQVRDKAMHLKLDELIKAQAGARDKLAHVEDLTEEQIEDLRT